MMTLVTCHVNSTWDLYWNNYRPNGHGENVTGYEQEDVGTNVEQGDEVSGCGGVWVILFSYLLQRSTTLVHLRSTINNYFRSLGFKPFQCIVPTIF
jgi:hypothetical protein